MHIWRVPYKLEIMDAGGGPRSSGTHVSDIIRDLAFRGRELDIKFADSGTMSAERVELGIAWEERLSKHHPEICFHPGEINVDDIAMTIDGASYLGQDRSLFHPTGNDLKLPDGYRLSEWKHALHEFKLTWKSSNRDLTSEFMWMMQVMSYLHGYSMEMGETILTAFWHIFWVNGNYKRNDSDPESGPTYAVYGAQFSRLEIKEAWDSVRAHRDRMQTPGTQVPLSSFKRRK